MAAALPVALDAGGPPQVHIPPGLEAVAPELADEGIEYEESRAGGPAVPVDMAAVEAGGGAGGGAEPPLVRGMEAGLGEGGAAGGGGVGGEVAGPGGEREGRRAGGSGAAEELMLMAQVAGS
jgi:hypothetical protein